MTLALQGRQQADAVRPARAESALANIYKKFGDPRPGEFPQTCIGGRLIELNRVEKKGGLGEWGDSGGMVATGLSEAPNLPTWTSNRGALGSLGRHPCSERPELHFPRDSPNQITAGFGSS